MNSLSENLYFRDLSQYPVLPIEEERALLRIIRQEKSEEKRRAAIKRLILGNLRFVISVARRYQGRGLSLLELINEGNLGLFKAAERFDDTRQVKFISYAVWWIRQSIQKALFEHVGAVRIPPNKLTLVYKFRRILMENGGDYEKTITLPEFAPYEHDINEVMERMVEISLDTPIGDGGGIDAVSTLLDVLGNEGEQEQITQKDELQRILNEVLEDIPPREKEVLEMFYGINRSQEYTLDEIGRELKLTRERVRQIKNKTLRKLYKHKEYRDRLNDFMES